jgi:hypothetical protein
MITIKNTTTGEEIFKGSSYEFMEKVESIRNENEDFNFSIIGISDAYEYINDYCVDLEYSVL